MAGGPAPGADPGLGDTGIHSGSLGRTYTFSPTMVLDGVIGVQRMDQVVQGTDFGKTFDLGIPGINGPDIRQSGFPNIYFASTYYTNTGVSNWMPLSRVEESFTMSHNLSWTKGSP